MDDAYAGFAPMELRFFFQLPVIVVFLSIAVAAILIQYSRGHRVVAVGVAVAWPLLVAIDFMFYGYPVGSEGVAFFPVFLSRATAILIPLVLVAVSSWVAFRVHASRVIALGIVSACSVAVAPPVYMLWLLTVGCLLTGDCL